MTRNVVIYNYLTADQNLSNTYPSSRDEIFFLQNAIGTLRACFDFVPEPMNTEVEEILEERIVEEVVVKPEKKEGEEEEEAPPPDEDEEGKKKFDPTKFDWFKIDGPVKTFPQLLCAMQKTEQAQVAYNNLSFNSLEEKFREIHQRLDEGSDEFYYVQGL